MLMSVPTLNAILNLKIKGVVHVGAHFAQEFEEYQSVNGKSTLWIDALPENISVIRDVIKDSSDEVVQGLVWSTSGEQFKFNVASNDGASSSVLEFGTHQTAHPEIRFEREVTMTTVTLAEVIPDSFDFNFLNLDIQGAELHALQGMGKLLERVSYLYTEVNSKELYKDCVLVKELDTYLCGNGFVRVATYWSRFGYGDAFYMQKDLVSLRTKLRCRSYECYLYGGYIISGVLGKAKRMFIRN